MTLRSHIAETIYRRYNGQTWTDLDLADALLADPVVQELLAAADRGRRGLSPKARAILDDYALSTWSGPDDR